MRSGDLNIKTGIKSTDYVAKLKYFETLVTYQDYIEKSKFGEFLLVFSLYFISHYHN